MKIREFQPDDWPAAWEIHKEVVSAGDSYAYDPDWTSEESLAVWVERVPNLTVVAHDGDRILGIAKMGPNRPGRGAHVSTASFMVHRDARGQGVGRALGEYALAWACEQGYASMQFNAVVETNTPAVRLWQSLGFTIVGTVPEAFEHATHGRVGLHVMHRYL
jgi:L-amino acid N-acyltransferase YncA